MTHRILIADDSKFDVDLCMSALEDFKERIDTVNDGQEALDYLYRIGKYAGRSPGNPAVVLLDLKMPKVDGLDVLRQIKTDPDLQTIPVVALTSSRQQWDIWESFNDGVNAYLVKPVDYDRFIETVRQFGLFWMRHNEPVVAPRVPQRNPDLM